jgi:alpha-tubulin suppressor-like RCC1 family protein
MNLLYKNRGFLKLLKFLLLSSFFVFLYLSCGRAWREEVIPAEKRKIVPKSQEVTRLPRSQQIKGVQWDFVLDSDDVPHIAIFDALSGRLMYYTLDYQQNWTSQQVDPPEGKFGYVAGESPNIFLVDDKIHVVYLSSSEKDKIARMRLLKEALLDPLGVWRCRTVMRVQDGELKFVKAIYSPESKKIIAALLDNYENAISLVIFSPANEKNTPLCGEGDTEERERPKGDIFFLGDMYYFVQGELRVKNKLDPRCNPVESSKESPIAGFSLQLINFSRDFKSKTGFISHDMVLDQTFWIEFDQDNLKRVREIYKEFQVSITVISTDVLQFSAGADHNCVVRQDDSLWCWGRNEDGQAGGETSQKRSNPIKVIDEVSKVSAGGYHTCIIKKKDKSLQCWGRNDNGQLGDGTTEKKASPVEVKDMGKVLQVSAGGEHTCAVKEDKSLWCWGRNDNGQVGDGTTERRTSPVKIMDGVLQVSAGGEHTCAVKEDRSLWCWGRNDNGQVGDGTTERRTSPIKIMDGVLQVSADGEHTCAVKEDRSLWCWGKNNYGQLGDKTNTMRKSPVNIMSDVSQVSAGGNHTCAVKDGTLWCWGRNDQGQLGDGTWERKNFPVKITDGVSEVNLGSDHTCFTRPGKTLWCFGRNDYGQLGDGTYENRNFTMSADFVSFRFSAGEDCKSVLWKGFIIKPMLYPARDLVSANISLPGGTPKPIKAILSSPYEIYLDLTNIDIQSFPFTLAIKYNAMLPFKYTFIGKSRKFPSVSADKDGRIHFASFNSTPPIFAAEYGVIHDIQSGLIFTSIIEGGGGGYYTQGTAGTAIAVTGGGYPLVVYFAPNESDMKVAVLLENTWQVTRRKTEAESGLMPKAIITKDNVSVAILAPTITYDYIKFDLIFIPLTLW